MDDCSTIPGSCIPKHTLIGGPENIKLLFDEALDNRREVLARQRAYEDLNLRRAQNAASLDHFVSMGAALAAQTGVTENQQAVSPIRTGAGDTQVQMPPGGAYPPNRETDSMAAVASGVVNTAMSAVAGQIAALTDVVTKLADAVLATQVAASVNAAGTAKT